MADIPVPRSYSEILGDLIDVFTARHGIPLLKVGGPILSLLESVAQSQLRGSQDIFTMIDARNLDDAEGVALDLWGLSELVARYVASPASGRINIFDTSFTKLSARVYQGQPAPIVGSTKIYVNDGANFPATGSIYLGRGTSNYEGPIAYTSKTDNGTYWTLNLAAPTLRFHNHGENVIVAQGGDRVVGAGTIVQTPRSSLSEPVQYRVLYRTVMPDGETQVTGVQVVCLKSGTVGNAPEGAIREFATPPYQGAECSNPLPFSNGLDTEDDDDYRERIRNERIKRLRGTPQAIKDGVLNVLSPDEGRRITSASFIRSATGISTLVVDDGTGYEETAEGVAIEQLIDKATGGERDLTLKTTPVAKAAVETINEAPYALVDAATLTVKVGGEVYTHVFNASEFLNVMAATAYEVVSSINANQTLPFAARTSESGKRVVLFAKGEENEDIEVVASDDADADANEPLNFPAGVVYTLRLYRNDKLLSKDGRVARLQSNAHGSWDVLAGAQTLILAVDGTPTITYTISDQDFVDAATGYNTVGRNSPAAWVLVLNRKIPGVTATTDGQYVYLTSNRGAVSGASIEVTGGTLVTKRAFTVQKVSALPRDYVLDRSIGQIRLENAATAGDRYSAGSKSTRAFIETLDLGAVNLTATARLWAIPDGDTTLVTHGVNSATPMTIAIADVHDWGHRLRLEAFAGVTPTSSVFSSVQVGDWVVMWDDVFPASIRAGEYRVAELGTNTGMTTKLLMEQRAARAARAGHQLVVLNPVGAAISKVMTIGGWTAPSTAAGTPQGITESCEIYDPNTKTWTAAAPMATARAYHTATVLTDGRVLVVGGIGRDGTILNSCELYDPTTNTWAAATAYQTAIWKHQAVRVGDGRVLVCGGRTGSAVGTTTSNSALYTVGTNSWSANYAMGTARSEHAAILLPDGRVFAAGGETGAGLSQSTEAFTVGTTSWAGQAAMGATRKNFGMALYSTTHVVTVGDDFGGANGGSYNSYTIGTNTWAGVTTLGGPVFHNKRLITLHNGNILALFGYNGSNPWSAVWNGAAWTAIANPLYNDDKQRYEVGLGLVYKADNSYLNHVLTLGGLNPTKIVPSAAFEEYDAGAPAWSAPDAAVMSNVLLPDAGVSIARSKRWIQEMSIPTGNNYTATSLVSALASQGRGLTTAVFQTNRIRLSTNSYAEDRDIALIAADKQGAKTGLAVDVEENLVGHMGSVETGTECLGTPEFRMLRVLEEAQTASGAAATVRLNGTTVGYDHLLAALRNHTGGTADAKWGRNLGFWTTVQGRTEQVDTTLVSLREAAHGGLSPYDRVYLAAPYAIGPDDTLSVLVDGDTETKQYSVNLGRKVTPVGSTYGATATLSDAENGTASLGVAFGIVYDFNDFAVYMKARAKAYSADATRSMLLRYYLHGPAGERARVRIAYPDAPDTALATTTDATTGTNVDIRVKLGSGPLRTTTNVRGTAKVGVGVTATTNNLASLIYVLGFATTAAARDGSDVTTLTLQLPPGVANSGLAINDTLYLNSTDGNWLSGTFTITAVGAPSGVGGTQTITFTNVALGTGIASVAASIGTVSFDAQGEATLQGASVVAGDFLRVSSLTLLPTNFKDATFRLASVNNQYVTCAAVEKSIGATQTTLAWHSLVDESYWQIFQNLGQTATAVVAAINALAAATDPTCPITAQVLGTGAGTVTIGTVESENNASAWITLEDGINWVASTTAPPDAATNYQFALKRPTSANLASDSAWSTEDVRLVPLTAKHVARWLNTPAVSGLFSAALVQEVDDGRRVQVATLTPGSAGSVQVQGGLANTATALMVGGATNVGTETSVKVLRSDAAGLVAGAWVEAKNSIEAQKLGVFTSATILNSWTTAGYMTFSTPVYTQLFHNANAKLHFERQGRYMCVSDPGLTGSLALTSLQEGDYIRLQPASAPTAFEQIATANQGIFRVVRVQTAGELNGTIGAVWYENDLGVEQTAECNMTGFDYDSIMPGDKIIVSTEKWGTANKGEWTVEAVGVAVGTLTPQFSTTTVLKVSVTQKQPAAVTAPAAALGTDERLVHVLEGTPSKLVKKVVTLSPDTSNGAYIDVRLDTNTYSRLLSETLGTVLSVLDKLDLPTDTVPGLDGYKASTGLIGEANRVAYGDPADTATYPGYVAAGARVIIQGPVVKRIQMALQLRTLSGYNQQDVASRVRSAIAAVVNRTGVGSPIPLSEVVRAAAAVQGVTAVTVLSPRYDATSDTVQVAANEKPMVLDLETDVLVSFAAE